jgi:hypothetical protein
MAGSVGVNRRLRELIVADEADADRRRPSA